MAMELTDQGREDTLTTDPVVLNWGVAMPWQSRIICATLLLAGTFAFSPAHGQAKCPSGKSGQWNWSAAADGAQIWIDKAQWQLGPGREPETAGEVRFFSSAGPDQSAATSAVTITGFPKSISTKNDLGVDTPLFNTTAHPYAVAVGLDGQPAAMATEQKWTGGFGLFGNQASFQDPQQVTAFNALMQADGPVVVALFTPSGGGNAQVTARFVSPPGERTAAWASALGEHLKLARSRSTCTR